MPGEVIRVTTMLWGGGDCTALLVVKIHTHTHTHTHTEAHERAHTDRLL